ncbi:MAG: nucleotidyltransferase domain-containing protein [Marmoricola sp.]
MNELARLQLAAVAEVLDVGHRLGADVWLRGGWATDFFLGEIIREHVDVDWFAWGEDLPRLADVLTESGGGQTSPPTQPISNATSSEVQ